jgi:SAM-dependent methyltransferase
VPKSALVLEVGSGGSPYFRANVLIDAYEQTRERHWAPLITDRPSVIGVGEALPFKDKSFDFVIASHVLEHSTDPENFLKELERVAKAGYIETPDAFMERINPYWDHRSEVTVRNNRLVIRKKNRWDLDPELVELYENQVKPLVTQSTIPNNPFEFHVRFYWQDKIPFQILNPNEDASWTPPVMSEVTHLQTTLRAKLGRLGLMLARSLFSQKMRNKKISLNNLLMCPACKSTELSVKTDSINCKDCQKRYVVAENIPSMIIG